MKLGWKLWLFGVIVAFSIVAILGIQAQTKLLVFVLLLGILFTLSFSTSAKKSLGIIFLILVFTVLVVFVSLPHGVKITTVQQNSSAFNDGFKVGETIVSINGNTTDTLEAYTSTLANAFTTGKDETITIVTDTGSHTFVSNGTLGLTVEQSSPTSIRTGLDLQGGARALVQPNATITDKQLDDLIEISNNRFNVYGLSDVQIKGVHDLEGNRFMLVEVAGATPADLENLISQQGNFTASVGNMTVFTGGSADIADVCRNNAACAGISSCAPLQDGSYQCSFSFTIYLTEKAAQRHSTITQNVPLDETGRYLAQKLLLYVDGKEVDSLLISSDLKGRVAQQISIQGSGTGATQPDAYTAAQASMKRLQTVLITGSLPYQLNIVKLDTISPTLGNSFTYLLLLAGIGAILVVSIIVFIRYRNVKAAIALLCTSFSEIIIILGVASVIRWNLDLPSIAGILATIGTGVDSQIVILDEAERGTTGGIKERIKRALFIIFSSYATALASLLPLIWAGAGLFQGFAITTIIGITAGVFVSRPAFAEIISRIETH